MSPTAQFAKNVTTTGLVVATVYAATRTTFRLRRAWRNMHTIESVDTGSVWTTE